MKAHLLFLHALSPLHAGTGQGVGVIDLPIAREKATNLPYTPGSTLKGVLRDNAGDTNLASRVFGAAADKDDGLEQAGSLQLSDARLLLLPVRSLTGTFAWVTSPFVLRRLARDVKDAGLSGAPVQTPQPQGDAAARVAAQGSVVVKPGNPPKVFLEDLDFTATPDAEVTAWATWLAPLVFPDSPDWQAMLGPRLCVVHDDAFNFLLETAIEVTARIRLDEAKKTVAKGGLWYEEALPAETILSALALVRPVQASEVEVEGVLKGLKGKVLQVGGKATVGRGLCKFQVH